MNVPLRWLSDFVDIELPVPDLSHRLTMAGLAVAIAAGGALASVETTVLLSVEETLEGLAKGKGIGYRKPGE